MQVIEKNGTYTVTPKENDIDILQILPISITELNVWRSTMRICILISGLEGNTKYLSNGLPLF